MTISPVATVVVTTHNRPQLAHRAIASVLAQTVTDLEVLVVDDGSTPPFVLGTADPRVRVLRNERAGGVSRARNVGLAEARGAWITFLDDDDRLVPEMLERSLAAAGASTLPPPVAVMSAVHVLAPGGGDGEVLVPAAALTRGEDYLLERRGAAGRAANSLCFPTGLLREVGGWDEEIRSFQHDDLGLRLNAVASIQGVAEPLYLMTTHDGGRVSEHWDHNAADMERTLARHRAAFDRHRRAHANYRGALSHYHLRAGHWLPALRHATKGVSLDPGSRRAWFHVGLAVAGPHTVELGRRLAPSGSTVPPRTLWRRRVRKYWRRATNPVRAVLAAPVAFGVRRVLARRLAGRRPGPGAVLLVGVYRAKNAATMGRLVADARASGWDVRLWALDEMAPELAAVTVGTGPGAKFPLLDALLADTETGGLEWVVVADDDLRFVDGSLADLLAVADAAGLDLVQPAHVETSHRDLEFTVRRPGAIARRTTFVEIGPLFACRGAVADRIVPFPPEHSMGWGLELAWHDLERSGIRLGIVDGVPLRHLAPVGKGYAKDEQRARLQALLDARGLRTLLDVQHTRAVWWAWRAVSPWSGEVRR